MKKLALAMVLSAACAAQAQAPREIAAGDRVEFEAAGPTSFTFPGRLGQLVSIALDGARHTPPFEVSSGVVIFRPDGSRLEATGCRVPADTYQRCKWILAPLPASGRYRIELKPPRDAKLSGTLLLNEDVACALERGKEVRVELPRAGQTARCAIPVVKGESLAIEVLSMARDAARAEEIVEIGWRGPRHHQMSGRRLQQADKAPIALRPYKFSETGPHALYIDPGYASLPSIVIKVSGS